MMAIGWVLFAVTIVVAVYEQLKAETSFTTMIWKPSEKSGLPKSVNCKMSSIGKNALLICKWKEWMTFERL